MAKPRITTKCPAAPYAGATERIVEFSNGERSASTHKGGLIAFHNSPDGKLIVRLYRLDPGVEVVAAAEHFRHCDNKVA